MDYIIPFNKPAYVGREEPYVQDAMRGDKISGDGPYSRRCEQWFEARLGCEKALLTPSCTQALEMAAILIGIEPGDEVIMPSYTFVSTANAFVLRGAKIVFVDIRSDTLNIDERLVESAITERTKAIVPVHYAGVACEMDSIKDIAARHRLYVIEDAAQGMLSHYKGRQLGSIGHLGAYSFHETKNFTSGGEGGLLIINDQQFSERAEIVREKGTNRKQFFRGVVDKYSWVDIGSSYLPSELQAAYLWGQLEVAEDITTDRMKSWNLYYEGLENFAEKYNIELPTIPPGRKHNGHMFYVKVKNRLIRDELLEFINRRGIMAVFHYVPLHSSIAGEKYGRFFGVDKFTTASSERVVRLPLWYKMESAVIEKVVYAIRDFFGKRYGQQEA